MAATAMDSETALAFSAARMLAVDEAPYLATALFAVTPLAFPGLGTFAVDARWRLYMDPARFATWTPSQAAAVLLHEIGHLVRDHAGRAESAGVDDHRRWNFAADAELNDDLIEAGTDLPPNCVTPQSLGCEPGNLAEVYYAAIGPPPPPPDGGVGDGTCGSGAGGPARPWEIGPGAGADNAGLDPGQADLVRQTVAAAVEAAAKARGTTPGGWERWAATQLAPPTVGWRKVLGGAIRQAAAWRTGLADYSYHRPGRRRVPRVITPAMRRPIPSIAVVVDTSGSMSRADLDAAMAEVQGIASQLGVRGQQFRLLSVDAKAHSATPVTDVTKIVLKGGGGTDMRVGITAAEALKPRPDTVVVLTDGETPWPDQPGPARLICAVISAQPPHGTPGWATTVHIPVGR